jgi:hypothetical protein
MKGELEEDSFLGEEPELAELNEEELLSRVRMTRNKLVVVG